MTGLAILSCVRRTDHPLPSAWDRSGLEALGFTGFVPLVGLNPRGVPQGHGVYVVLRPDIERPHTLLEENPVRRARLRKYTLDDLNRRWVAGTPVVYIGKAMGQEGLRGRLKPFSKKRASHSGGRAIWQLQEADSLLVCWKEAPCYPADRVEDDLIDQFKAVYGLTPFANVRERGYH